VLGLPRGGMPVAFEIARALSAPLDVLVVRKVGAPGNPEYGLGAVVEGAGLFLDEPRVRAAGYRTRDLEGIVRRETEEVARRSAGYRRGRPPVLLADRTVILADDGAATGGTIHAALQATRARHARHTVVALGVAPSDTLAQLRLEADRVAVALSPSEFFSVGEWYERFEPVADGEISPLLETARAWETRTSTRS
jgi:putative phosphoribosyl transferase